MAEYVSYNSPYARFETSLADEKPSLSDIFQTHNNGYTTSPYTWGALAVAFFAQQKPQELTQMLTLMREGQWDDWDALMVSWSEVHQTEFAQWLSTGPRIDFETSAKSLTLGSYELVEGRGGWLYQVEVPEGTDSLTIAMTGGSTNSGSMDLDLMVSAGQVPHWSFGAAPQCALYKEGNEETCTFTDITPGTYYITLDEFHSWAADIVDVYVTACTGTDCLVDLPEPKPLVEFVDVVLPVEPLPPADAEVLPFSSCDLVTSYSRTSDESLVTIVNTTETPVRLYWVNHNTGQPNFDNVYATLAQGEEYTADYWAIGDRMMLADSSDVCLGVAEMTTTNNKFVIDDSSFGG